MKTEKLAEKIRNKRLKEADKKIEGGRRQRYDKEEVRVKREEGLTERLRKAVAEKKVIKEEERGCGRKKGRSRGRKAEREEGRRLRWR